MKQLKLIIFLVFLSLSHAQESYSKNDSVRVELEQAYFKAEFIQYFKLMPKQNQSRESAFLSKSYEKLPKKMDKLIKPYLNRFKKYTNYNYELNTLWGSFDLGQETLSKNPMNRFDLRSKSFLQKEFKYKKLSVFLQYNYDWKDFNILNGRTRNYNSINSIFSFDLNKQSD